MVTAHYFVIHRRTDYDIFRVPFEPRPKGPPATGHITQCPVQDGKAEAGADRCPKLLGAIDRPGEHGTQNESEHYVESVPRGEKLLTCDANDDDSEKKYDDRPQEHLCDRQVMRF